MYSQSVAAKLVGSKLTPNGSKSILKAYKAALATGRTAQLEWIENRIKYNGHWLADKPEEREFDLQFYALYASCWWGLEDPYSASFVQDPEVEKPAKERGIKLGMLGPPISVPELKVDAEPWTLSTVYADGMLVYQKREGDPPAIYELASAGKLAALSAAYGGTSDASGVPSAIEQYEASLLSLAKNHTEIHAFGYLAEALKISQSNVKEDIMSTVKPGSLNITTVTYINGTPLDSVTDETIYAMITERETMIQHYETMKNRPERLKVSLTNIQAEIDSLVKLVDSRN